MDIQPHLKGFFGPEECDISEFERLLDRTLEHGAVPQADRIVSNIPVYKSAEFRETLKGVKGRQRLMAEWAQVLMHHSGVLVLEGAYADTAPIDQATEVYNRIMAQESAASAGGADHFATAGANQRIWNSLQKLCLADPETFVAYFANPVVNAVCEAWLGPNYQMTAQVNLVHPGGTAQQAHRDYHLGFQTAETCALYPAHVHDLSPVMTLQGAIAHTDMPVESGPTKLLPFSQGYRPGYAAYRLEEFKDVFEKRYVQLPLKKGDAVFFNPALFHAAGANTSPDIERFANLLQISSAFGRAMETIDRQAMCLAVYPVLKQKVANGLLSGAELEAAISSCAEGYSFPTNLDNDPPVGGLAPETQKQLLLRALGEDKPLEDFRQALEAQANRRKT